MKRWMLWLAVVSGCCAGLPVCYSQQGGEVAARVVVPAIRLTPAMRVDESVLRYVPDDVVMVGAMQPARMLTAETLKTMTQSAQADDLMQQFQQMCVERMGLDPTKITEVAMFLDRQTLQHATQEQQEIRQQVAAGITLRNLGLAMHNFHDAFGTFPDDDGVDEGKGNLSWRVHLLPFLDEQALYDEFRQDEPWDSEHNKALISRMPEIFKVEGVESGQTSVHVLLGKGTPFEQDEAPGMINITDGTSNTIMFVQAGADTAEFWTKPGGLTINPEDPVKALGKTLPAIPVGMMDGSMRLLQADAAPEIWRQLAQHQDGEVIESFPDASLGGSLVPGLIVRYAEDFDQAQLLPLVLGGKPGSAVEIAGLPATRIDSATSVVFPNPRTMLISSESALQQMLAQRQPSQGLREKLEELFPAGDIVLVSEAEVAKYWLRTMQGPPGFLGFLAMITQATLVLDATGAGPALLDVRITTDNPQAAVQLNGLVTGGFQMVKAQVLNQLSQPESPIPETLVAKVSELLDSATVTVEEQEVTLNIPKLENAAATFEALSKEMTALAGIWRQSVQERQELSRQMAIKQMVLAMHTFHDVHNGLPMWNGQGEDQPKGLSWRVHLLPYMGLDELYSQFHLDEPWDSEHNKTLIEKMPDIFRTGGVDAPGSTSYHVFLGDQTPVGGKSPQSMRNITDGTSNTLLIVKAGADKADIWTKPGGLEYVAEDPLKCMGNVGKKILVAMCDGSTRLIDSTISSETFRRLIEHADGEIIEDF